MSDSKKDGIRFREGKARGNKVEKKKNQKGVKALEWGRDAELR